MTLDISFFSDMVIDLLAYKPILSEITHKYMTAVNMYAYLFVFLLPFYLYNDPYFAVRNITHLYLALCSGIYMYNKNYLVWFGVPSTFIIDRILKLQHDTIVYMMVIIVIATSVEYILMFANMFKILYTNRDFHEYIITLMNQYDEPAYEYVDEHSDEQINEQAYEPVEQQVNEPVEQPIEQQVDEPVEQPVEQQVDEPVDESVEQQVEQQVNEPVEQPVEQQVEHPVEQIIGRSIDQPVDEDLSDLPELI